MGAAALNGVEKSPYTGVLKEEEPRTTQTGAVIGGEANGLFQSRRSDAESAAKQPEAVESQRRWRRTCQKKCRRGSVESVERHLIAAIATVRREDAR